MGIQTLVVDCDQWQSVLQLIAYAKSKGLISADSNAWDTIHDMVFRGIRDLENAARMQSILDGHKKQRRKERTN